MLKRIFTGLLPILLLTACGAPDPAPAPSPPPPEAEDAAVTFTDDLGREVSVAEPPERVAALIGSFADVWCLAGGRDTLVAAAGDAKIGRAHI